LGFWHYRFRIFRSFAMCLFAAALPFTMRAGFFFLVLAAGLPIPRPLRATFFFAVVLRFRVVARLFGEAFFVRRFFRTGARPRATFVTIACVASVFPPRPGGRTGKV